MGAGLYEWFRRSTDFTLLESIRAFFFSHNSLKDIGHIDVALSTSTSSSVVGIEGGVSYEPTPHKSVDYRAFKRGFQASRNQSRSLYMTFTK